MKKPLFSGIFRAKKGIYMDYGAAAPEILESRRAYARAALLPGNPSSIHKPGLAAAAVMREARKDIAKVLSAHPDEIIFLGSGTESDNLAVMGAFKYAKLDPARQNLGVHIITTAIEHSAVLEACKHIEAMGGEVTYLSVGDDGRISIKELRAALRPETVLVSIAYANNEIGVIQPVRDIAKEIRHHKKNAEADVYPLFHTDACQAAQYENINVEQLGVDMLTLNGSKLGGPRGTALLYLKRGTPITPIIYGGGQESGMRSGTENVPGAAGLAAALRCAHYIRAGERERLESLREFFFEELAKRIPNVRMNGSRTHRLANNVHISIPNIQSELLVIELDAKGIAASAGSACSSAKETSSHVLAALYGENDEAKWGSVRFSMGKQTTKRDVEKTLSVLESIVQKYSKWR